MHSVSEAEAQLTKINRSAPFKGPRDQVTHHQSSTRAPSLLAPSFRMKDPQCNLIHSILSNLLHAFTRCISPLPASREVTQQGNGCMVEWMHMHWVARATHPSAKFRFSRTHRGTPPAPPNLHFYQYRTTPSHVPPSFDGQKFQCARF